MYVNLFGTDYYLDEKAFAERMKQAANENPWHVDEIVALQHRMKGVEDCMYEYMQANATPDPIETLRRHLDEMIKVGCK